MIAASHNKDQDVFGFARKDTAVTIAILFIRNGLLNGSRTFFLADPYGDDGSILSQVLGQFYDGDTLVPGEILLPFAPADLALIEEYLSDHAEMRVHVKIPQRGDGQQLVAMATTNALQFFEEKEQKNKSWENLGAAMQKTLNLKSLPARIECLDISNIGGKQAIGSLVCFTRGEPDKANFRHYKIKTVEGPNDYAMMGEVLDRRLRRGLAEEHPPRSLCRRWRQRPAGHCPGGRRRTGHCRKDRLARHCQGTAGRRRKTLSTGPKKSHYAAAAQPGSAFSHADPR